MSNFSDPNSNPQEKNFSALTAPTIVTSIATFCSAMPATNAVIHDVYHYGLSLSESTFTKLEIFGGCASTTAILCGVTALVNSRYRYLARLREQKESRSATLKDLKLQNNH